MATDGKTGGGHLAQVAIVLIANALLVVLIFAATAAFGETEAAKAGGASETAAFVVGFLHVGFGITAVAVRASAPFLDAEQADEVRRQGRALLLGAVILIAAGVSLILLALAGPGGLVAPDGALVGWLLLSVVVVVLGAVRWRLLDELDRALAHETARLAASAVSLVGGTWAMLAHLGFAPAPEPLDWLTMFAGFGFAASMVELSRRGGLTRSA